MTRVLTALALLLAGSVMVRAADVPALVLACDLAVASPADDQKPSDVPGVARADVQPTEAVAACEAALQAVEDEPRMQFNLGRALAIEGTDLARAAGLYRQAADAGYVIAMVNYGSSLENGWTGDPDLVGAARYYQLAAEKGSVLGMGNIGLFYEQGRGVAQDYTAALAWYEKAAALGDAWAMNNAGNLIQKGLGTDQDDARARDYFERAVQGGDLMAFSSLGKMYEDGAGGLDQDVVKAVELYKSASDEGHPEGMKNFGEHLLDGNGVSQDVAAGVALLKSASDAGNEDAAFDLARMLAFGLHGQKEDFASAGTLYLDALERGSAAARETLIEHRGLELPLAVIDALQAQMQERGYSFTAKAGRLNESAITALTAGPGA